MTCQWHLHGVYWCGVQSYPLTLHGGNLPINRKSPVFTILSMCRPRDNCSNSPNSHLLIHTTIRYTVQNFVVLKFVETDIFIRFCFVSLMHRLTAICYISMFVSAVLLCFVIFHPVCWMFQPQLLHMRFIVSQMKDEQRTKCIFWRIVTHFYLNKTQNLHKSRRVRIIRRQLTSNTMNKHWYTVLQQPSIVLPIPLMTCQHSELQTSIMSQNFCHASSSWLHSKLNIDIKFTGLASSSYHHNYPGKLLQDVRMFMV
jgi:hypothetical protein